MPSKTSTTNKTSKPSKPLALNGIKNLAQSFSDFLDAESNNNNNLLDASSDEDDAAEERGRDRRKDGSRGKQSVSLSPARGNKEASDGKKKERSGRSLSPKTERKKRKEKDKNAPSKDELRTSRRGESKRDKPKEKLSSSSQMERMENPFAILIQDAKEEGSSTKTSSKATIRGVSSDAGKVKKIAAENAEKEGMKNSRRGERKENDKREKPFTVRRVKSDVDKVRAMAAKAKADKELRAAGERTSRRDNKKDELSISRRGKEGYSSFDKRDKRKDNLSTSLVQERNAFALLIQDGQLEGGVLPEDVGGPPLRRVSSDAGMVRKFAEQNPEKGGSRHTSKGRRQENVQDPENPNPLRRVKTDDGDRYAKYRVEKEDRGSSKRDKRKDELSNGRREKDELTTSRRGQSPYHRAKTDDGSTTRKGKDGEAPLRRATTEIREDEKSQRSRSRTNYDSSPKTYTSPAPPVANEDASKRRNRSRTPAKKEGNDDGRSQRRNRSVDDDDLSKRPNRSGDEEDRSQRPNRSVDEEDRWHRPNRSVDDDDRSKRRNRSVDEEDRSQRRNRSVDNDDRSQRRNRSVDDDDRSHRRHRSVDPAIPRPSQLENRAISAPQQKRRSPSRDALSLDDSSSLHQSHHLLDFSSASMHGRKNPSSVRGNDFSRSCTSMDFRSGSAHQRSLSPLRDYDGQRERSVRTRRQVGAAQQNQMLAALGPRVEAHIPAFATFDDDDDDDGSVGKVEPKKADPWEKLNASLSSLKMEDMDDSRHGRGAGMRRSEAKRTVTKGEVKHNPTPIAPGTYRSLINS